MAFSPRPAALRAKRNRFRSGESTQSDGAAAFDGARHCALAGVSVITVASCDRHASQKIPAMSREGIPILSPAFWPAMPSAKSRVHERQSPCFRIRREARPPPSLLPRGVRQPPVTAASGIS
jgi:hypothetical protein